MLTMTSCSLNDLDLSCLSYKEESEAATESDELIEMEASQSQDYSNNDAETIEAVIYSRVGKVGGEASVLHGLFLRSITRYQVA